MGVDELSKLSDEGKKTYKDLLGIGDHLETSGGLTLGAGTEDEVTIDATQLKILLDIIK